MTGTREGEKPWKTDLARKAAQRREQVGLELDELIKKAASFEDALRPGVELVTAGVARDAARPGAAPRGAGGPPGPRPPGAGGGAGGWPGAAARWPKPLPDSSRRC